MIKKNNLFATYTDEELDNFLNSLCDSEKRIATMTYFFTVNNFADKINWKIEELETEVEKIEEERDQFESERDDAEEERDNFESDKDDAEEERDDLESIITDIKDILDRR